MWGDMMRSTIWGLAALLAAAGCDDGDGSPGDPSLDQGVDMADAAADLGPTLEDDPLALEADCDPLVSSVCALPWPSDKYLVDDANRVTGKTMQFGATTLPANGDGVQLAPEMFTQMDGYGVGVPLMVILPNLDPDQLLGEFDIADTIADGTDIVWLEVTDSGARRVPYYAELDPFADDPAQQILFVRPGEILKPNTRYVVAFRNLEDTDGEVILPSAAFAALRDGRAAESPYPNLGDRQADFDAVFADLEAAGVDRGSLQLAWAFNTASSEALHGDMLDIRRKGFEAAGPDGPELTLTTVEEYTEEQNAHIWLDITGTMKVPHFMEEWGLDQFNRTHWAMHRGDDGKPAQNGWRDADIWIRVPHAAKDGTPQGLVMYGHGQQGRGSQVRSGDKGPVANENNLIFFACDLAGMSEEELAVTPSILIDLNLFPWIADRLHQGLLDYLLLTRAMMRRAQSTEAFSSRDIVVDDTRVYYSGISQGGIFGASFMALTQDVQHGHLGVPGAHYFTLIGRSRNFNVLGTLLASSYPKLNDQRVGMIAAQQLWNKTDPVSYYRHISAEPFENDAPRRVLLTPAKGDPQVSVLTAEWPSRSDVGVAILENYDTDREVPLAQTATYPHAGSGVVLWQYGNAWPAPGPQPPEEEEVGDPHSTARRDALHNRQMVHFWETGEIIDVCEGVPCGEY
jgi:hypothetical protein